MSSPQNTTSTDPAGSVVAMLQSIEALGDNTGRLFGRLYGGLRRKNEEREAMFSRARSQVEQMAATNQHQATDIARLTGVLAVISEGVIMQDTDGRIVLMNQAAKDLLGSMRLFWDSDLGKMFAASRQQRVLDGEITLGDPQRVEVNDKIIGAQLAIVADHQGQRLGTVLMLRDVTRDALSDRLKDQFVTQMSHELRTPLTAIKGMSEVLLASPADRAPNRKFLEAISRNAAVLDRMIVELLDISEIGAGSFAVRQQDVNLEGLVFTVIRGLENRTTKAELHLEVWTKNQDRLTVVGDDRRLQWALGHLVDNAIKYTEPGGKILVRIGRVRNGYLLLEVSDTGVGISPRDLPHIFERFYRGEARSADGKVIDPRGLGQGLFVARAVAEAHGGYISAASQLNEGSTFTFGIPLEGADEAELPPPAMPAAPSYDGEPPVDAASATVPHEPELY